MHWVMTVKGGNGNDRQLHMTGGKTEHVEYDSGVWEGVGGIWNL